MCARTPRVVSPRDAKLTVTAQDELFPIKYGPAFYDRLFMDPDMTLVAALERGTGRLIGVATASIRTEIEWCGLACPRVGHLLTFGVTRDKRRTGVGTHLLRHTRARLELHQVDLLELNVLGTNEAAIRFYECNGFHKVSHHTDYYFINDRPAPGYTMRCWPAVPAAAISAVSTDRDAPGHAMLPRRTGIFFWVGWWRADLAYFRFQQLCTSRWPLWWLSSLLRHTSSSHASADSIV